MDFQLPLVLSQLDRKLPKYLYISLRFRLFHLAIEKGLTAMQSEHQFYFFHASSPFHRIARSHFILWYAKIQRETSMDNGLDICHRVQCTIRHGLRCISFNPQMEKKIRKPYTSGVWVNISHYYNGHFRWPHTMAMIGVCAARPDSNCSGYSLEPAIPWTLRWFGYSPSQSIRCNRIAIPR